MKKMFVSIFMSLMLRRKNITLVPVANPDYEQSRQEKALVVSGLKNVQALGYTFSRRLLETLFHCTRTEFTEFYASLMPALKELVGADVTYRPMYPNFPAQVAEASEAELFINAIIHYWSFGTMMPKYHKNERLPLIDSPELKVIDLGTMDDLMKIFANLVASRTSLSVQDKEDLRIIMDHVEGYEKYLPDTPPFKENMVYLSKIIAEKSGVEAVQKWFKTATDVLRFVTALSDGDISLSANSRFRNLKRGERRMVMDLLAGCGSNLLEDMYRNHQRWLRVGEIVHPFEFKQEKYKKVVSAFNTLRNEKKPLMFGGKVYQAMNDCATHTAVDLLVARPGEFARNLDKLLRDTDDSDYVLYAFEQVADKVATPLLLQVAQHFDGRITKKNDIRVFFPKGSLAKAYAVKNDLPEIDEFVCERVRAICVKALKAQYSSRDPMGKVYIDPAFVDFIVPFSQRSASKTVKAVTRGSQLPIREDAKAVRGFIWWTNTNKSDDDWNEGRVDIDLSAAIYDEDWNFVEHVSYTRLRSERYQAYHSGDITNGSSVNGNGVAEFLDVDIDSVANNAGRYVVYQVYSFTNQPFESLPNVRFGWMEREDVNSGEIFEPSTVAMKMDLTANATTAIPVIFDCKERKFIWCDMALAISGSRYGGTNLESNLHGVTATCYALTHLNKPNLFDLVLLNAEARGRFVADRNQADVIFSNDTTVPYEVVEEVDEVTGTKKRVVKDKVDVPIITAFDTDYFVGQLL